MPSSSQGGVISPVLANLIEKYAAVLEIDNLPEPPNYLEDKFASDELLDTVEKEKNA